MALMVIGIAAAICASAMAVPQAWRCIRAQPSGGVSPLTWYLIIANASLWILWAFASRDYVVGIPSLVTLPAASIVVIRSHVSEGRASLSSPAHSLGAVLQRIGYGSQGPLGSGDQP